VLGGRGFFGTHAVRLLREAGVPAIATGRSDANVEDRRSLRAFLHPHDVVLDAAGPFHRRSAALLEIAMARGLDVVDLSDSAAYAQLIADHEADIDEHHIAVLTGCSAISAVTATLVGSSGIGVPSRVDAWLAPASKETANVATARSLLAAVRGGVVKTCRFAPVTGLEVESALGVQLPAIWPALQRASFWVDPHVPGLAALLGVTRAPILRRLLAAAVPIGVGLARLAGSRAGLFAVEAEGSLGSARWLAHAARGSYVVALAPAVLAVKRLASDDHAYSGLVPADAQVAIAPLLAYLRDHGVTVERV
jgi:hypothetical protein